VKGVNDAEGKGSHHTAKHKKAQRHPSGNDRMLEQDRAEANPIVIGK
jgi:hypothetical protein